LLLSKEIFNPNYLLFSPAVDNNYVFQPNRFSYYNQDHLHFFKFIGRFVGKSLYDGHHIDAYFTRSFYKHILGLKPSYHDIESIDPEYYKGLKWMAQNQLDGADLGVFFTVQQDEFGMSKVVDLKTNGSQIEVTDANKHEYLSLLAEFTCTKTINAQINAFLEGFRDLIPVKLISIFSEKELELLIAGTPDIDVKDLQANCEYHGWGPRAQAAEPIRWFWAILAELTDEELALLLLFVTGTSKVPIGGFKMLQGINGLQKFQIHRTGGKHPNSRLPTAHTCFNQLDLPEYTSMDAMRNKLLIALNEGSTSFGFR
jgi:E3 ubiquitin-protein ligase HUWE1